MRTPRTYVQRKKGFGTQPPATLFRRAFTLSAAPRRARLYATCLGVYRLTVNGKRPDMREFAPEHTSYKGLLCFQTYDLTALLHIGENVLGMEVGDGWYCCPQPLQLMNADTLSSMLRLMRLFGCVRLWFRSSALLPTL